jgi:deferrochelatase/peroxidase EfeB
MLWFSSQLDSANPFISHKQKGALVGKIREIKRDAIHVLFFFTFDRSSAYERFHTLLARFLSQTHPKRIHKVGLSDRIVAVGKRWHQILIMHCFLSFGISYRYTLRIEPGEKIPHELNFN